MTSSSLRYGQTSTSWRLLTRLFLAVRAVEHNFSNHHHHHQQPAVKQLVCDRQNGWTYKHRQTSCENALRIHGPIAVLGKIRRLIDRSYLLVYFLKTNELVNRIEYSKSESVASRLLLLVRSRGLTSQIQGPRTAETLAGQCSASHAAAAHWLTDCTIDADTTVVVGVFCTLLVLTRRFVPTCFSDAQSLICAVVISLSRRRWLGRRLDPYADIHADRLTTRVREILLFLRWSDSIARRRPTVGKCVKAYSCLDTHAPSGRGKGSREGQ